MNRKIMVPILVVAALVAGIGIGRFWPASPQAVSTQNGKSEREILYWVAPMDPNFRSDKPGKSPMGMDLVPVYADEVDKQPGGPRSHCVAPR